MVAKDLCNQKNTGLSLIDFINKYKPVFIIATGINKNVKNVYRYLGYKSLKLEHFYLPASTNTNVFKVKNEYNIINYSDIESFETKIVQLNKENDILNENQTFVSKEKLIYKKFCKDIDYLIHRYIRHPNFNYHSLNLFCNKELIASLVVRIVEENRCKIIRIVDIIYFDILKDKTFYSDAI